MTHQQMRERFDEKFRSDTLESDILKDFIESEINSAITQRDNEWENVIKGFSVIHEPSGFCEKQGKQFKKCTACLFEEIFTTIKSQGV